ncbi:MAG: hypothetical protein HZA91_10695 [Verrucomicrobia bacterium]|nr:hypothetical protein [Verrucomicrobiota bacterium]
MRRKKWAKPFLRGMVTVLGLLAGIVMLEIMVQGFGGHAHPVASWGVTKLGKIFTPIGQWFVEAPDWAWISLIAIINIPTGILMTWALDVGGLGFRPKQRPYWFALCWVILVCGQLLTIYWARQRPGL